MTPTDIRESLTEVRDAVPVPPIDAARFDARVRHHRRRRRALQAGTGAGVLAAATAIAAVLPHALHRDEPTPVATAVPADGVPIVLDGRVQQLAADGSLTDTGLSGTPIGRLDGRLVVLDGDRLLGLADGPIDGVVTAYVDPFGVTYQTTDGLIVFAGQRGQHSAQDEATLLAGGASVYVDDDGSGPRIHDSRGVHPVDLGSDGASPELDGVEAAGGTVVFVHDGGVEVYDARGERRDGFLGGTTGALSGDGATYAYAPGPDELEAGMTAGLSLYDTGTRDVRRVPLADPALDLAWYDGDVYVLTQDAAQGAGERSLWRCDTDACDRLLTEPGESLSLS
jgi:hypothetical protein